MTELIDTLDTHVIRDDGEAIAVAAELAGRFAESASAREANRALPYTEIDELSASGLLGISVPADFGGADVKAATLAQVFRLLAAADPNIAQIPQSHFVFLEVLRLQGSAEQRRFFFAEVLAGRRFGNAQAEAGARHALDVNVRLRPHPEGGFVIDGVKHYTTGALFAHWLPVPVKDAQDRLVVAYLPADAPGLTVVDDWEGFGQRLTASGTVRLDRVRVPADRVVPHYLTFTGPQLYGATAQLLHAAIDTGIARGALTDAAEFVRTRARPIFDSGVDRADQDPLTIQRFGELEIEVRGAEALLAEAGRALDSAQAGALDEQTAAAASIAVAAAKTVADRAAIEVTNALFEVSGARSAVSSLNLHRHWRNARTHTLHDAVRWKVQHVGRYTLNGTLPPRHGQI